MFKYLKSVWREKSLRSRILFVIVVLTITRVLAAIPIPGIDSAKLAAFLGSGSNSQLFGLLNLFSGGGLSNLSIVMLGVGPYITASIIMQLATVLYPKLKELQQEEGDVGRRKFAAYTRYLALPLAFVQGYSLILLLKKQSILPAMTMQSTISNVLIVVAGTMLMLWLGEQINWKGIGNGTSLIIFAGIVATLPAKIWSGLATFDWSQSAGYVALLILSVLVIAGIVYITEAERPLEIVHAKQSRGYASEGFNTSYLPLRLNMAGVVPIIFAVSILLFPQLAAQLMQSSDNALLQTISSNIGVFLSNKWAYGLTYFGLVIIFTYFYTAVTFDPVKTAENLQKSGAFVPGQRPGEATSNYIGDVMTKLTFVGAIFLGVLAILPVVLQGLLPSGFSGVQIGGTSLLIAVSVVLDLMKKIDAQMSMSEY